MHCVFFVLWLSGFVALPAVYDDPVITVLSLASAVMRVIGNIYKLFTIIGGRQMRNLSNIIKKNDSRSRDAPGSGEYGGGYCVPTAK